jgi:hypothetical protein
MQLFIVKKFRTPGDQLFLPVGSRPGTTGSDDVASRFSLFKLLAD